MNHDKEAPAEQRKGRAGAEGVAGEADAASVPAFECAAQAPFLVVYAAMYCRARGVKRRLLEFLAAHAQYDEYGSFGVVRGWSLPDIAREVGASRRYLTALLASLHGVADPEGLAITTRVGWNRGQNRQHVFTVEPAWPADRQEARRRLAAVVDVLHDAAARRALAEYAARQAEATRNAGGPLQ